MKGSLKTCPLDRELLFEKDHRPNQSLKQLADRLKVICKFKKNGCNWIGERRNCLVHFQNCGFEEVKCSPGCGTSLLRNHLEQHKGSCKYRIILCDCGIAVVFYVFEIHKSTQCGTVVIKCEKCQQEFPRKDLLNHQEECPEEELFCPHKQIGCVRQFKRKEKEEHLQVCQFEVMKDFITSVFNKFQQQENKLQQQEEAFEELKRINGKQENEIVYLKELSRERTCIRCKTTYRELQNQETSCKYHPGLSYPQRNCRCPFAQPPVPGCRTGKHL